jgi:photosystem II stability/assembly factor-like uncharacterized protein
MQRGYLCSTVLPNNNRFVMRTLIIITCFAAVMLAFRQAIVATSITSSDYTTQLASLPKCNPITDQASALMRSVDGGQTWTDLSAELPITMRSLNMGAKDNRVHISVGSTLYEGIGTPVSFAWAKQETNLEVDNSRVIYGKSDVFICAYREGLFKEMLKGSGLWVSADGDLADKTIRTFCERSNGDMFVGTEGGVFRSTNGGAHWDKVLTRGQVNGIIEADGILICTYYTGIDRSADGGTTWETVFSQPKTFPYEVQQSTNGLIGLIEDQQDDFRNNTSRLATSNDGGKTWQFETMGLDQENLQMGSLLQVGSSLLISHSKGISRSSDGGKTWELVYPLGEPGNYRLVRDGDVLYAAYFMGC